VLRLNLLELGSLPTRTGTGVAPSEYTCRLDRRAKNTNCFRISESGRSLRIEMNERRQDFELLQRFARHGEKSAFADVVRRHLDMV
jgi:hypothetical protein